MDNQVAESGKVMDEVETKQEKELVDAKNNSASAPVDNNNPLPTINLEVKKIARDAKSKRKDDKTVQQVLKSLNNLKSPEEKLSAMCKKYSELLHENRQLQGTVKQAEKDIIAIHREKEQFRNERSKAVLARTRMEQLCRELQKMNKAQLEETTLKFRAEEEKRKEICFNFQTALAEMNSVTSQCNEKNAKMHDENLEMKVKLIAVRERIELHETQLDKVRQQAKLDLELAREKMMKDTLQLTTEKEALLEENCKLQLQLAKDQCQIKELQSTERFLRTQIKIYEAKFEEFNRDVKKATDSLKDFRPETRDMKKKVMKLEKETALWKQRWEKTNADVLYITKIKEEQDTEIEKLNSKLWTLQELCRAFQRERTGLLAEQREKEGTKVSKKKTKNDGRKRRNTVNEQMEANKVPGSRIDGKSGVSLKKDSDSSESLDDNEIDVTAAEIEILERHETILKDIEKVLAKHVMLKTEMANVNQLENSVADSNATACQLVESDTKISNASDDSLEDAEESEIAISDNQDEVLKSEVFPQVSKTPLDDNKASEDAETAENSVAADDTVCITDFEIVNHESILDISKTDDESAAVEKNTEIVETKSIECSESEKVTERITNECIKSTIASETQSIECETSVQIDKLKTVESIESTETVETNPKNSADSVSTETVETTPKSSADSVSTETVETNPKNSADSVSTETVETSPKNSADSVLLSNLNEAIESYEPVKTEETKTSECTKPAESVKSSSENSDESVNVPEANLTECTELVKTEELEPLESVESEKTFKMSFSDGKLFVEKLLPNGCSEMVPFDDNLNVPELLNNWSKFLDKGKEEESETPEFF